MSYLLSTILPPNLSLYGGVALSRKGLDVGGGQSAPTGQDTNIEALT